MIDTPAVDFTHQSESSNRRKKRLRSNEPAVCLQAQQRFVVRDRSRLDMHERLVVENESVILQRMTDGACPVNVLSHAFVLLARHVVELDAVSSVCFCG